MPSDVAVIIVNYRTADMSVAAVDSVLSRPADGLRVEVHLVDNASPGNDRDVFLAEAARWGDAVTLHLETENHGFGRGNNVVLRELATRSDRPAKAYLLNPDARLVTNAVAELSAFLDAHPAAAVVGSAILQDGTAEPATCAFRFPSILSEFEAAVAFGPVSRLLSGSIVAFPPEIPTRQVDWVSGASMMVRLDAVAEVGFFDPDFFLYYEEVDLMRRLRRRGWEVWHLSTSRVIHVAGASTGINANETRRPPLPAYWYESWRMYFEKQHGRTGARLVALSRWTGTLIGNVISGLRRRPAPAPRNFASDFLRRVLVPLFTRKAGA